MAACAPLGDRSEADGKPAATDVRRGTVADEGSEGDGHGTTTARGAPEREERTGIRIFGIEIQLPQAWDSRMFVSSPGELPVVHAATLPLPTDEGELDVGKAASRRMTTNDVRIILFETGNQVRTQGFHPTRLPVTIGRSDFRSSPFLPRNHALAGRRFAVHGRPFALLVEFGNKRPSAKQLTQANDILLTLVIDPRPELDPAQWEPLRRPLTLPSIPADGACPRSSSTRAGAGVTWPLGPGPAYPAIGSPNGVANLKDDLVKKDWYLHKTLWAISPRYRGPLLIRGRRLDGPGMLRFRFGLARELKLHKLRPSAQSQWRYAPSHTALREPGCYGFQVDGTDFTEVIIFQAVVD
jgi:hypothetical protein